MIAEEIIIKYHKTLKDSPDFNKFVNEYLNHFELLSDYDKMCLWILTLDLKIDYTNNTEDFINNIVLNVNVFNTLKNIDKLNFQMDGKDVGSYLRFEDKIFKVYKRCSSLNVYDEKGNLYDHTLCEISSLKEFRYTKIKMLNI